MPDSTFAATPAITSNYYFAGEYLYQTDKATLKIKLTGSTFCINNGEIATRLAEQYLALKLPTGKGVSVNYSTSLSPTNDVDHTSTNGLTVTQIIGLHPGTNPRGARLTGRLQPMYPTISSQQNGSRSHYILTTPTRSVFII